MQLITILNARKRFYNGVLPVLRKLSSKDHITAEDMREAWGVGHSEWSRKQLEKLGLVETISKDHYVLTARARKLVETAA